MQNRKTSLGDRAVLFLATGFGLGWAPFAPGTFGSLVGVALVGGLLQLENVAYYLVATLVFALLAIPLCGRAAKILDKKDPGSVVFDEIVALPITFLPLVFLGLQLEFTTAIAGFAWFRLFDIVKPWPVRNVERLPEGFGIVADDLVAGVYAAGGLWLTIKVLS